MRVGLSCISAEISAMMSIFDRLGAVLNCERF
jgi:hypothetical protein